MTILLRHHPSFQNRDVHGFDDDFDHIIEGQSSAGTATDIGTPPWSETGDAGGETHNIDGVGGQITLNTDADNNDEWYFYRTRETFLFADKKPLRWECRLKFEQVAANTVNLLVGVMDAVAADSLLDDGGGPSASYSGLVIFVEDGQTEWSLENSLAGTQVTTRSDKAAASSSFFTLAAEFNPFSSTQANCFGEIQTGGGNEFVQFQDTNTRPRDISHIITYSSATEMTFVIGLKAGVGTAPLVTVDRAACYQVR